MHNNRFSALKRRLLEMRKTSASNIPAPVERSVSIGHYLSPNSPMPSRISAIEPKSPIPHLTANACGRDRKAAATATSAAGRRGRRRAMRLLRLQGAFARSLFRRAAAPCQPSRRSAKLPHELSVFERQPGTGRKSVTSVIAWRSATCRATGLGIDAEESANASIGGPRSSLCCVSFCAQRRLKSRQQRVSGGVP